MFLGLVANASTIEKTILGQFGPIQRYQKVCVFTVDRDMNFNRSEKELSIGIPIDEFWKK